MRVAGYYSGHVRVAVAVSVCVARMGFDVNYAMCDAQQHSAPQWRSNKSIRWLRGPRSLCVTHGRAKMFVVVVVIVVHV